MEWLRDVSTQQKYPLLYWTTMFYILGIPNFVHFDASGRTANTVNLTSISLVVESLIVGYLVVVMLLLEKRPILVRKIRIDSALWISLLVVMLVATAAEPQSRSVVHTTFQTLLALFRLGQWVVAFVLIVALYTRTPAQQGKDLVIRLIGRASWIWVAIIWILLPIIPAQVYGLSEENGESQARRLGGQLVAPAHAALLGSIAFFYALFFFSKGPRKWLACSFTLLTIVLTGARAQQAGFLLALFLYAIVFSRKPAIRWATIGLTVFCLVLGVSLSEKVTKYVSRGQSAQSITSLNDRTRVWEASFAAIRERPLIGYGYSVGARYAIKDHWKYAHWIPPNAHNEFIEAAVDGGILAAALVLCIYVRVLWRAFRTAKQGPRELFLFLVLIQYGLNTLTGTEITNGYGGGGGVFFLCCVAVMAGVPEKIGSRFSTRRSSSVFDRTLEHSAV